LLSYMPNQALRRNEPRPSTLGRHGDRKRLDVGNEWPSLKVSNKILSYKESMLFFHPTLYISAQQPHVVITLVLYFPTQVKVSIFGSATPATTFPCAVPVGTAAAPNPSLPAPYTKVLPLARNPVATSTVIQAPQPNVLLLA